MKYCKRCKIKTNDEQTSCPLCYNELEKLDDENFTSFYPKRKENEKHSQRTYFATRIFTFISLAIVIICAFINFLTYAGSVWSILVASCIVYLWILISHTILSKSSAFEKIIYQIIGVASILLSTEVVAGESPVLINYIVPSLSTVAVVVLAMINMISRKRKSFTLSFFIIYILLSLIPIITLAFKLLEYKLLMQINLLLLIITITGTLILGYKTIKSEISKKFHL